MDVNMPTSVLDSSIDALETRSIHIYSQSLQYSVRIDDSESRQRSSIHVYHLGHSN